MAVLVGIQVISTTVDQSATLSIWSSSGCPVLKMTLFVCSRLNWALGPPKCIRTDSWARRLVLQGTTSHSIRSTDWMGAVHRSGRTRRSVAATPNYFHHVSDPWDRPPVDFVPWDCSFRRPYLDAPRKLWRVCSCWGTRASFTMQKQAMQA